MRRSPPSIYIVPTFGGLPKKLADGECAAIFAGRIANLLHGAPASGGDRSRSAVISAADGTDKKEIKIEKRHRRRAGVAPGRKGLALLGFAGSENAQDRDWYFVRPDSGSLTPTGAARRLEAAGLGIGGDLGVTADGVLFTNGNIDSTNMYRMPFDATFQNASGAPVPVVVGAGSASLRPRRRTDAGLPSRSETTCRRTSGGRRSIRARAASRASRFASPAASIRAWLLPLRETANGSRIWVVLRERERSAP